MSVKEIQKLINEYYYWDMRAIRLECNYFADEIELVYDDSEGFDVTYHFVGCYKAIFDHEKGYDKFCPVKEMSVPQIPYFLQNVEIGEMVEEGVSFYTCKINMFPLDLEIWCKDIIVIRQEVKINN